MSGARERVREHLLAHSVRRGEFILKSGRPSTWFIDAKQTILAPEAMEDLATLVLERVPDDATAIGGLTMGADGVSFVTAGVAATREGCCEPSACATKRRTMVGEGVSPACCRRATAS